MKCEGSFPWSLQPATYPYPKTREPNPCSQTSFFNIHFKIILPSGLLTLDLRT
jgi:hypothetical protein